MARAVLGPNLIDLTGKLGNSVYNSYSGLHTVRALPAVVTNPQSTSQTATRSALAVFVSAWRGLTLAQKKTWDAYASYLIKSTESEGGRNSAGLIRIPRGPYSGYNAFISCNMNRYSYNYSILTSILLTAPITQQRPEPLKTLLAVVVGRTIAVSWEYITPGVKNERLGIWIKSVDADIHPQIIYTEARNADGTTIVSAVNKTSGTSISLPDGVYQVQAIIINEYGIITAPSELVKVQLGAASVDTYFANPIIALSLPNQNASTARTIIDVSASIPDGAIAAILLVGANVTVGASSVDNISTYQDATTSTPQIIATQPGVTVGTSFNQGIQPLKSDRSFEYDTTVNAGNTTGFFIFIIGYIT
jgi:hypothetical protein